MNNDEPIIFLNRDKDISDKDIYIAISLEEYKELLMIKGKYEELKSYMNTLYWPTTTTIPLRTNITYSKPLPSENEEYNFSKYDQRWASVIPDDDVEYTDGKRTLKISDR